MATACSVVMANDVYGLGSNSGGIRAHTATNCVLMTIAVVSICALVVCGVLVVREYSLAMSYLPTTCRIGNITYARHDVTCKHCASGQLRSIISSVLVTMKSEIIRSKAVVTCKTRKPCYRKETARCGSRSLRFNVRRHSLQV